MNRRLPSPTVLALAWAGILAIALTQHVILRTLSGRSPDLGAGLTIYGPFVLAWGLATPWIWRMVRRWPVRGNAARSNALRHLGLGIAFILATNALLRLPLVVDGFRPYATSLATGLTWYGPFAIIAWTGLVALGHLDIPTGDEPAAFAIGEGPSVTVLDPDDIVWVEARDNYVRVHGTNGPRLVRYPISALEKSLDPARFVRVHRSAIIAVNAIRDVRPAPSGNRTVTLSNGATLNVPRARRAELERALATYRSGPGRNSAAR